MASASPNLLMAKRSIPPSHSSTGRISATTTFHSPKNTPSPAFEVVSTTAVPTSYNFAVNGIPLAVIEAKRPDGQTGKAPTINEGISQSLRNQRHDESHSFLPTVSYLSASTVAKVATVRAIPLPNFGQHGEDISDIAMRHQEQTPQQGTA